MNIERHLDNLQIQREEFTLFMKHSLYPNIIHDTFSFKHRSLSLSEHNLSFRPAKAALHYFVCKKENKLYILNNALCEYLRMNYFQLTAFT